MSWEEPPRYDMNEWGKKRIIRKDPNAPYRNPFVAYPGSVLKIVAFFALVFCLIVLVLSANWLMLLITAAIIYVIWGGKKP